MEVKKGVKHRLWIYGGFITLTVGGYFYQPVRIDFLAKPPPNPNPAVDPDSKGLFSKNATVMVVTAHPDDAEYYLGAFLPKLDKAGAHIDLLVCTDGDKGFYPWENVAANRVLRRSEQLAAARVWHAANVYFLGFPDGRLHPNPDVVEAIGGWIDRWKPGWLITYDAEYPPKVSHGDHRSAGQAAALAAKTHPVPWLMMFATHAPNDTVDVSDFIDEQKKLLALHASQFSGKKLDDVANSVAADAMDQGQRIAVDYGVDFRCARPYPEK